MYIHIINRWEDKIVIVLTKYTLKLLFWYFAIYFFIYYVVILVHSAIQLTK